MLRRLLAPLLGVLSLLLFVVNLIWWCIPFYLVALVKVVIRTDRVRLACDDALAGLAALWIDGNNLIARMHSIDWDIELPPGLSMDEWYLVCSNHRSWVDIFVLQRVFNRRIPFLKFFIKKELIWIPLLGLAWWAIDLPFMQRHSREEIKKNPSLRSVDLETTRRACERFRHKPTAITNFAEGTRFTEAKHARQKSPYRHLLRPKAGGLAFVLGTMGNSLDTLLHITIFYPGGQSTFWDLLSGRIGRVVVRVSRETIPLEYRSGDYLNDKAFRAAFQQWVSDFWAQKDAFMEQLVAAEKERGT